ncbi:MAG: tannase/feruloyl esterase family alpha/beta hydrolase [Limisphaerales bacterium]
MDTLQAPDKLMAEQRDASGKVIRTRPLFPFPPAAKHQGSGNPDDAENFISTPPRK